MITKLNRIMSISLRKLKKRATSEVDEKPPKKSGRFDGLSEEEVKKNTLKDILKADLDLVFVGINPSLMAAHTGRYYAGPGNHFYKLLFASELIPEPITYEADDSLLKYDIGLTNIVARATRSSADLSRAEIKKGAMFVHEKLKKFKPKVAVFNGKCIYEEFTDKYDKSTFKFGLQPHRVGDTALWVVPSSSARCANFPRMEDKLHFYTSLKKYLAYLKGEIGDVDLNEFRFEGRCKTAVPSTSKMWRRKGLSAFANGGRIVNKETICMDTSEENILSIPNSNEFILKNSDKGEDDEQKDSGVSACQSDNSQGLSQSEHTEESSQEIYLKPKTRSKHTVPGIKKSKSSTLLPRRERTETIDFVSMIKKRLTNKDQESNENNIENNEQDKLKSETDAKGLKYRNLRSTKSKSDFKLKTSEQNE
ncbi:G/T mismatch-specific thymine DNA glycosylase-like [Phymastichus coffea]|uniref:G/T mismatch-specific thymine DNA glycosylase-like n=1 Tax=Phymastichus coffea TaxID=108790 RepID=UPI00273C6F1F|nr:G/T mismatch-specific thymine DNA glycosylase-like [Phymastichus coffea]